MLLALDEILAKLSAIPGYVASVTTDLNEPVKTATRNFYSDLTAKLSQSVIGYYNDKTDKTHMMRVIIMAFQQYAILDSFTADGLELQKLSGTYEGADDLRLLYNGNGVLSEIISLPESAFYEGAIVTDPDTPIDPEAVIGEGYLLYELSERIKVADKAEAIKRQALNAWLNSTNIYNAFMLIFEQGHGQANASIPDIASNIYLDRHIRDIIWHYNLDVYIPSYLRS